MDIIEEHPDLIKFDNDSYYNRRMQINFAHDVLLEFIKEALTTLDFSSDIYSITEIPCDNGSTKNWLIEFDLNDDDDEYRRQQALGARRVQPLEEYIGRTFEHPRTGNLYEIIHVY
jgi:hypothetical protein